MDLIFDSANVLTPPLPKILPYLRQGSLATWGSPVREEFDSIPDGYKLLCGVSIGFPNEEGLVNSFNPGRGKLQGCGWGEGEGGEMRITNCRCRKQNK